LPFFLMFTALNKQTPVVGSVQTGHMQEILLECAYEHPEFLEQIETISAKLLPYS
jgi:hypothetical protein